uniref:DNA polymerase alpha subunit B n=2 Tax=Hirondellea gigas TaxID=1518452 RepID=A0A6A7FX89_9CRUS
MQLMTLLPHKIAVMSIELCSQYGLAADQLAATWLGFAATNSHDEMTLDRLNDFEKDTLNKKKKKPANRSGSVNKSRKIALPTFKATTIGDLQADEDLLLTYGASPVAASKFGQESRRRTELEESPLARDGNLTTAVEDCTAPATPRNLLQHYKSSAASSPNISHLSPCVAKPSQRYSGRSNSGAVVSSYGSAATDDIRTRSWGVLDDTYVPQFNTVSDGKGKIMFEKLRDTAEVQEDAIMHMADEIAVAFGGPDCWSSLDSPSNERVHCIGRVCCDSVGKLNSASVLLEGSRELSAAAVTRLDLSNIELYALFPGQVIGVSGVNSTGKCLVVDEMVAGRVPPFRADPITIAQQTGPVQLVIASGPFTTSDNLLYEPLQDLLNTVASCPPHVLLLLGPLLDANHPLLLEGSVTETYQAVVNRVLSNVATALVKCNTEVFVVSSCRDVTSSSVYPTSPLTRPPSLSPRLHLLADPSLLMIEGVVIALTTLDVVMDLGKEETCVSSPQDDRLHRLVHHVLAQQCLYPLNPPPDHLCVSPTLLHSHASLNYKPHLLVLPSDIRAFVKEVHGCVTVNTERLCKGMSGGCYARVELRPPTEQQPDRPDVVAAVYRI